MKVIVYFKDINLTDRYRNLLSSYSYKILNEYSELYSELQKESSIILMNIDDCNEDFNSCIKPLVELNAYLMILDHSPTYEKGKELISIGIRAYGNLMMDDTHLKEAINSVMDGNIWLYPEFINETVLKMKYDVNKYDIENRLNILSLREKEVALLVIKKLTYLDISEKLGISLRTVKAHTKNIYEKFNVSNRLSFLLLFNK